MKLTFSSCLWKIAYAKGKTVFLFGTIHLPVDTLSWNKNQIFNLIGSSDQYFGEIDLDKMESVPFNGINLLPEGRSLQDYFRTYKEYNKVRNAILKSFKIDLEDYKRLKPLLIQHILDKSVSGGEEAIMDHVLWEYAKENKVRVEGLESVEDQLKVLDQIDIDFQIKTLKTISRNTQSYHSKIRNLIHSYNQQNIKLLYRNSVSSLAQYKDLMVYKRNVRMADKIHRLKEGKYFISVGVGHLYGKSGLLAELKRKDGVKVRPEKPGDKEMPS